jgi:serine/threonine-protein kinase RsbW
VEHLQQTFKLSVPSDTSNLAMIRDFVERAARRSPIEGPDLERLKLAVDEACANVMEHAYKRDATKELTVRVSYDQSEISVEVIDSGPTYDPTQFIPRELADLQALKKDGGMGIRLMKMATDDLVWSSDGEGHNCLRLVKRISK